MGAIKQVSVALGRARDYARYMRLRSFDTSSEAGRSDERHRRIVLATIGSGAARATSIATALISVPLTLHYLGAERYGMWMTMSAFTAMLSFADLGIGNGVLSAVARATGRDELGVIRSYISSAFALLATIAVVILAALAAAYTHVQWGGFFNASSQLARTEAGPSIAVLISCFALSLPLGIVQRVQLGMQMGLQASLWQCIASAAGLIGVLVAVYAKAGLPWLMAAYAGAPVVVAGLNSLVFFSKVRPDFAPRPRSVSRSHGSELASLGFLFFVLQLAVAVTYTSDNIVIAHVLGPEQVARYAIPDRLFAIASMIVGLAVTPLWPAFGESLARGDHAWARRTLIRGTLSAGFIAGGICLFFLAAGPLLLHIWVGPAVETPFMLLLGLAVWRTLEASAGAASMYLNAMRAIRFQIGIAVTTAAVAIGLKILLLGRFGISVMPWVTAASYVLFAGVPMWLVLSRLLRDNPHARSPARV